jgi:RNA polymerase sigma-70 factor, ECF subfamily
MTTPQNYNAHNFGLLFVQHEARIYGLIRSLVTQKADAEDVFQETAAVLWQKFAEYQPGSNFAAWAFNIARFQVRSFYHQKKRNAVQMSEAFWEAVTADTVSESVRLSDLQTMLARCLAMLSPTHRNLFIRYSQTPGNAGKLAEELNRPVSSIYHAVHRIRRLLVECVDRALSREAHE